MYDIRGKLLGHRLEVQEEEISTNDNFLNKFGLKSIKIKIHGKPIVVVNENCKNMTDKYRKSHIPFSKS